MFTGLRSGKEVDYGRVLRFLFSKMLQYLESTADEGSRQAVSDLINLFVVEEFLARLEQMLDKEIKLLAAVWAHKSRVAITLRVECDGTWHHPS